ncbi:MAG: type II 3-dehydroquinate dehydratase [Spirochaetia bacterium]|nr:type II 3-dehydroquinate dehydratase [Spirochaetia bacterium]
MKIAVINGPNLNMLGIREKEHYGAFTLEELEKKLTKEAGSDVQLSFMQSNHEGNLIDYIQNLPKEKINAFIFNPGAFTHTSLAIRDAVLSVKIPFIEVHISNIYAREEFRKKSYFSDIAEGIIAGLGMKGYLLALNYFKDNM